MASFRPLRANRRGVTSNDQASKLSRQIDRRWQRPGGLLRFYHTGNFCCIFFAEIFGSQVKSSFVCD
jgi:hypothetical protein